MNANTVIDLKALNPRIRLYCPEEATLVLSRLEMLNLEFGPFKPIDLGPENIIVGMYPYYSSIVTSMGHVHAIIILSKGQVEGCEVEGWCPQRFGVTYYAMPDDMPMSEDVKLSILEATRSVPLGCSVRIITGDEVHQTKSGLYRFNGRVYLLNELFKLLLKTARQKSYDAYYKGENPLC